MRKTWKKKLMKRRVAICGGREAVADFVQGGGVKLTPPPVKIGLSYESGISLELAAIIIWGPFAKQQSPEMLFWSSSFLAYH